MNHKYRRGSGNKLGLIKQRKNIVKIILIIFSILISFTFIQQNSFATTEMTYFGTVMGMYGDPPTSEPLTDALIELLEDGSVVGHTHSTSPDGEFSITYETSRFKLYSIRASRANFYWKSKPVPGSSRWGSSFEVNFELEFFGSIQTTFKGHVYDNSNPNEPIENARVYLIRTWTGEVLQKVFTDSTGYYEFEAVTNAVPRDYDIAIHKSGIKEIKHTSTGLSGGNNVVDFTDLNAGKSVAVIAVIAYFEDADDLPSNIDRANEWYSFFKYSMRYDEIYFYGNYENYLQEEYLAYAEGDYQGPATFINLMIKLDELGSNLVENDMLSVIFGSHGIDPSGYIVCADDKSINDLELKNTLPLQCQTFVYFGTCFSGYWLEYYVDDYIDSNTLYISSGNYVLSDGLFTVWFLKLLLLEEVNYYYGTYEGYYGYDHSMEEAFEDTHEIGDLLRNFFKPPERGMILDGDLENSFYL
ncbi:MAG: carboxypeptidase regulatory-like domain-containing protein [Candidatus Heimdallarchaeota archaeon]|nr:carboxypeptidase regulatory-like domain-containing protein [Candidatus Heimdallarchaeota archaeon]